MKIDKNFNLVVPVDSGESETVFHSAPILRETFKKYHFVICATFTRLITSGMELTGAKIAAMTLEDVGVEQGKWESRKDAGGSVLEPGIKDGLIAEIERLTHVIVLTESGWEAVPVGIAVKRDMVSEEDWEEAKQRIVFFTLLCAMTRHEVRNDFIAMMNDSWQTLITSLNSTDYANSLPISKEIKTLPAVEKQSSIAT